MSTGTRVAAVVAPVLLLLAIVVGLAVGDSRDEKSYAAGQKLGRVAAISFKGACSLGICEDGPARMDAVTPEGQCRLMIKNRYGSDPSSRGYVLDDMIDGCLDRFPRG
jgi:hypothetical protein